MWIWRALLLVVFFSQVPSVAAVPPVITYANNQVLKDAHGNLFYHDGRPLWTSNGDMKYPAWQGGGVLRETGTWSGQPRMFYPNGTLMMEYTSYLHYPGPNPQVTGPTLYNGWSYFYGNGKTLLARGNWGITPFYYASGATARDGQTLYLESGVPTNQVHLWDRFGPYGYFSLLLHNELGGLQFRFGLTFDVFNTSYITPIVFTGENGMPPAHFEDFTIGIQTGRWGEKLRVRFTKKGAGFAFDQISYPVPLPGPYPPGTPPYPGTGGPPGTGHQCPHVLAQGDRPDPQGFVRLAPPRP